MDLWSGSGNTYIELNSDPLDSNAILVGGGASSAPFRVTKAGELTATSGKIGGFEIGTDSLGGAYGEGDVAYDGGVYIYRGGGIGIDAGIRGNRKIINLNVNNSVLASFYYDGGSESITPMQVTNRLGSIAIMCDYGMFAGLRPHISSKTSGTLTESENVIICNNSSASTINLPSSPRKGQAYLIFHPTSTTLTINGNGRSIRRLVASGLTTVTSTSSTSIECIMCNWDGNYWYLTYIKVS